MRYPRGPFQEPAVPAWRSSATLLVTGMALVACIAMTMASPAGAQASRGQAMYSHLGCSAGNCHGTQPGANLNGILGGSGNALAIEYSATRRVDKEHLLSVFNGDPSISADLATWLATVVPSPRANIPIAKVVEYVHGEFGHYFITSLATEIAALDSGQFAGWTRTGLTFNAYSAGATGLVPVCRFFTVVFTPKSSHFYTPFAGECDGLKDGAGGWQYEGNGFFVDPAEATGHCPTGSIAVYRMYNNGIGGAPNHRYTIDALVRAQMVANGWVAEGLGPNNVIFCAPT